MVCTCPGESESSHVVARATSVIAMFLDLKYKNTSIICIKLKYPRIACSICILLPLELIIYTYMGKYCILTVSVQNCLYHRPCMAVYQRYANTRMFYNLTDATKDLFPLCKGMTKERVKAGGQTPRQTLMDVMQNTDNYILK